MSGLMKNGNPMALNTGIPVDIGHCPHTQAIIGKEVIGDITGMMEKDGLVVVGGDNPRRLPTGLPHYRLINMGKQEIFCGHKPYPWTDPGTSTNPK